MSEHNFCELPPCGACAEKDREIERLTRAAFNDIEDLRDEIRGNAKELEAARWLKKGDYAYHLIGCTGATIRSCTCGLMALMEAIKDE